ncbi:hypothetical protein TEQG_05201 [Trichophyton equinum CBS 127.97]|uniref:Uncharacterized protein n=1 Tax=Trichophyton equinum (strain ATCC MYA-4606 / CBS 127.97) TaxID=559882 RepID=F2PW19_TRIEC|nr:hypothetical protein TEQG_05201 [Trichophyton equinum CBS 127.97]
MIGAASRRMLGVVSSNHDNKIFHLFPHTADCRSSALLTANASTSMGGFKPRELAGVLERWLHNQGLEGRSDWPDVRRGRKEMVPASALMEHRRTLSRNKAFVPRWLSLKGRRCGEKAEVVSRVHSQSLIQRGHSNSRLLERRLRDATKTVGPLDPMVRIPSAKISPFY